MDAVAFLNTLRFRIRKYLPTWLFDFLFSIWRKVGKKIFSAFYFLKLKSFKGPVTATVEHDGVKFKICVNPKNGYIDQYIFLRGAYEPHILDLIKKHLPEGGTFFDVGANIGQHSLFAAACLKGEGGVHAFEPLKGFCQQFQKSIIANGYANINIHNFACGNSTERKQIYTKFENASGSSIVRMDGPDETHLIEVKKIDDVFEGISNIDLMKIDVEGFEYEVLQGAAGTIARTRPKLIIEFSPYIYETYNPALSSLILGFLQSSYELYDVEDGNYIIQDSKEYFHDFIRRNRRQTNFLCLPK